MRNIVFKKKFRPLIENKSKIQTIRNWKSCSLEKGEKIELLFGYNGDKLTAEVIDINKKTFNDITDEDARNDGFSDKTELYNEIKAIYGFVDFDQKYYLIKWNLIDGREGQS